MTEKDENIMNEEMAEETKNAGTSFIHIRVMKTKLKLTLKNVLSI